MFGVFEIYANSKDVFLKDGKFIKYAIDINLSITGYIIGIGIQRLISAGAADDKLINVITGIVV